MGDSRSRRPAGWRGKSNEFMPSLNLSYPGLTGVTRLMKSDCMKLYFVYILASQKNGTLYVGITSNMARRLNEHRAGISNGFTRRYKVFTLVHCEVYSDPAYAIARERRLKKWNRDWKVALIERENCYWDDLSHQL